MPTTKDVHLNIQTDASQWNDAVYGILMIEYEVEVLEQFAYRMGQEFKKLTTPEKLVFINFERVKVWEAFQKIRNQNNEYIRKFMNMKFEEGMRHGEPDPEVGT